MAHNIAFVLIGMGILALLGWAGYILFTSSDLSLVVKIAAGALLLGLLILGGAVIRDRAAKARSDKYKEVEK